MGGLMATAMKYRGFAGAIVDASVRDTPQIKKLQFPVFSRGIAPSTTINHYRFAGVNIPVTCAGARVNANDIIVADEDGVAVVPRDKAAEVLKKAQQLDDTEHQMLPFIEKFKSIREAVRHNAVSRHKRGASTISQQVARNMFLWSGRSYVRKGLEAGITLLIEWCWPKERILEVYLNIAQFGPDVYGVQAAAQRYYHKDARRLNRADSALLAAVLPNPVRLRVEAPSNYVLSRRDWIAEQMVELGGTSYLNLVEADTNRKP